MRLCGELPFRHVIYLMNKKDKDLEDEQCMMENHRCYGRGRLWPCDTLSMKMDKARRTEDQHSEGKVSID